MAWATVTEAGTPVSRWASRASGTAVWMNCCWEAVPVPTLGHWTDGVGRAVASGRPPGTRRCWPISSVAPSDKPLASARAPAEMCAAVATLCSVSLGSATYSTPSTGNTVSFLPTKRRSGSPGSVFAQRSVSTLRPNRAAIDVRLSPAATWYWLTRSSSDGAAGLASADDAWSEALSRSAASVTGASLAVTAGHTSGVGSPAVFGWRAAAAPSRPGASAAMIAGTSSVGPSTSGADDAPAATGKPNDSAPGATGAVGAGTSLVASSPVTSAGVLLAVKADASSPVATVSTSPAASVAD